MADVFISYTNEDGTTAAQIAESLIARGCSVWWDPAIRPGQRFAAVIESQLDATHCVVVLWSSSSIASEWVNAEATEALRQGKYLPVILEGCRPPLIFREIHAITSRLHDRLLESGPLTALINEVEIRLARIDELRNIPSGTLVHVELQNSTVTGSPSSEPTLDQVVSAFLEGAGLARHSINSARFIEFFRDAGVIMRQCLEGTMNLARAQEEFNEALGIQRTKILVHDNNPLKMSVGYEDVVSNLLLKQGKSFVRGPAAVNEAMKQLQDHAILRNAAFRAVLEKVREVVKSQSAADFRNMSDDELLGLFMDTYAQAYEQQMNRLASQKR